jgi:hypothetical protein
MLAGISIVKGQPFNPDAKILAILDRAAASRFSSIQSVTAGSILSRTEPLRIRAG